MHPAPHRRRVVTRLGLVTATSTALVATAATAVSAASAHGTRGDDHGRHHHGVAIKQTNLVADQASAHAVITDPNLVNPWGLSHGPDTPLWVSDNGKDVTTLYTGAVGTTPVSAVPLVVSIPGGAPTGQVFNDTHGFRVPGTHKPALFIFAGEHGDLSAWNQSVSPNTSAVAVAHARNTIYKGLTLVHTRFGPLLLATDFHNGKIDVYDSHFHRLHVHGLFRDRNLPRGYAPFGIATIDDRVVVTYAKQDANAEDDVKGAGHGFVDVYSDTGIFLRRLISGGDLNSPWGLSLAPSSFRRLAGALLVGNFGDGRIHAYDPRSGREIATLRDGRGHPIVIDGLWGLLIGDPSAGGTDVLWFSAGPQDESHGLLGTLSVEHRRMHH
jgi:uncharacterized protein (TIGR03118 family)